MGFIDSMYDVMAMETAMLKFLMNYLKENYLPELKILDAKLPEIKDIPSVTFLEAMEILRGKAAKNKFDLEPEDEVKLCEYAKKEFGSEFIFVTHFPAAKRPFYAMNDREDPRTALSFDLLFRGLEITTGGQRINDYNEQVEKMKSMGMDISQFPTYLDIHKYGMPPHGGLGIGLERLLMKLLELPNVRQASMFPRDLNRLLP
jgi:aspartyl/asparaginyl-tRNA synthetase